MNQSNTHIENKTGIILLESAVLRFMSISDTSTQESFAAYIEANRASDTLLETLSEDFPKFIKILNEEIASTRADLQSVLQ